MSKHKEIEMWAAELYAYNEKRIRTYCITVTDTGKQYRIRREDTDASRACDYKSRVNKSQNCWLFETELEAVSALEHRLCVISERSASLAFSARENLGLATAALEKMKGA